MNTMAAPARPWSGPQHRLLEPEPLLEGLDGWVHRWMGRWARRPILARELHRMARVGHALQEDTRMLDDAALRALQQCRCGAAHSQPCQQVGNWGDAWQPLTCR